MNPRHRKKRPSYGIRTVEINRGKNGFGFTISGQAPCILSCIITGSPAEKAGLRPGDYLIAVNSQDVSKALHDDVVELIGTSSGILKLQIAENYYSDSSEEECISVLKFRPKCTYKFRHRQFRNSMSRAEKVVHDLQTGALFIDHVNDSPNLSKEIQTSAVISKSVNLEKSSHTLLSLVVEPQTINDEIKPIADCCFQSDHSPTGTKLTDASNLKEELPLSQYLNNELVGTGNISGEVFHSIFTEQELDNIFYSAAFSTEDNEKYSVEQVVLKAVVGYLGTIEMPKEPQLPVYRLQTIRNCIRRLRVEKKVHTLALMSVYPHSIVLTNMQGLILAEYCTEKIAFSGVYSDDEKFFGLVTTHEISDDLTESKHEQVCVMSSSCHVFMVDPKLAPHHQHKDKAKAFHFLCTMDLKTNKCKEFPESAEIILKGVAGLYRSKYCTETVCNAESQPSTSPQASSNSSNCDSGIGFKDEGTSRQLYNNNRNQRYESNNLAFCEAVYSIPKSLQPSETCFGAHSQNFPSGLEKIHEKYSEYDFARLTVRAMPDPIGYHPKYENSEIAADMSEADQWNSHIAKKLFGEDECQRTRVSECPEKKDFKDVKLIHDTQVQKLSPKVYNFTDPCKFSKVCSSKCSVDFTEWQCYACTDSENSQLDTIVQPVPKHSFSRLSGDIIESGHSEYDVPLDMRFVKSSSVRRYLGHKKNLSSNSYEAGTVSDGELSSARFSNYSLLASDRISDTSLHGSCISDRTMDVGRAAGWAAGFNVLLQDPVGLQVFSEFLKIEFCQENIIFWIECENYRQLKDRKQMAIAAQKIYSRHLSIGASEPVNVDSHARRVAEEGLDFPTQCIFLPAQKQIFNLMKFDCYQRFLKSSIFKESVIREMQGQSPLCQEYNFSGQDVLDQEQKQICEDRKRPLFSWNKFTRSKSSRMKVGPIETRLNDIGIIKCLEQNQALHFQNCDAHSMQSDSTSSRTSLSDSDPGNDIQNGDSQELNSHMEPRHEANFVQLRYKQAVLFTIELPNKKEISVKAKCGRTCEDILKPILQKYGYKLDKVSLHVAFSLKPICLSSSISVIDRKHIIVQMEESKSTSIKMSDLETLTNQIFEDLMNKQQALVAEELVDINLECCRNISSGKMEGHVM